jgi:hypothetical protein
MLRKLIFISFLLFPEWVLAAPAITGHSGTLAHGDSYTITGSGFGTKSSAAPVAFGDMENNSVNARIGAWTNTFETAVSTSYQRNSHSTRNAVCTLADHGNGQDAVCAFEGGSDAASWYAQNWFYLGSDYDWMGGDNGNNKIFRMWSTGDTTNNLRIQGPINNVDIYVEAADEAHGGTEYGSPPCDLQGGWYPVVPGGTCADMIMSGTKPSGSYWGGGDIQWRRFATDMNLGTWHLFQFEFRSSDVNTANGVLRWWVDGKLIFNHSDVTTRTSSQQSHMRPKYLGIESIQNSGGHGATGHYYLDDVYIDNTWQRVEIGNNATYNSCTLKEIQPATSWADGSVTFTVNQGSFADGATGYIFVTDASGVRNTGYTVTFGGGGEDTTAPSTSITTTDPSTITANALTVVGTASDAVGVSGCKWRITSAPDVSHGAACTGTTSFSCATSGYSSGANTMHVACYDAAGNYGDDSIVVNYNPPIFVQVLGPGIRQVGGSVR